MALVKCMECSKEISDTAKTCPHCGYKFGKGLGTGGVVFMVGIAVIVIAMITGVTRPSSAPVNTAEDEAKAKMAEIAKECMHEAGIPDGQPDYRISTNQLDVVAECTDRKMKY